MKKPRWQFTIRGAMLATFWMAVCFASFAAITSAHRQRVSMPAEGLLTWVMMIAPFAAVGALFRRAVWGAAIGVAVVAAFLFVFWLA